MKTYSGKQQRTKEKPPLTRIPDNEAMKNIKEAIGLCSDVQTYF